MQLQSQPMPKQSIHITSLKMFCDIRFSVFTCQCQLAVGTCWKRSTTDTVGSKWCQQLLHTEMTEAMHADTNVHHKAGYISRWGNNLSQPKAHQFDVKKLAKLYVFRYSSIMPVCTFLLHYYVLDHIAGLCRQLTSEQIAAQTVHASWHNKYKQEYINI